MSFNVSEYYIVDFTVNRGGKRAKRKAAAAVTGSSGCVVVNVYSAVHQRLYGVRHEDVSCGRESSLWLSQRILY